MAKPRKEKEIEVRWLEERFGSGATAVLTDYRGLDVEGMTDLRRRLRAIGGEMRVVKNTLAARAARAQGLDGQLAVHLEGPTAIAFSTADPTGAPSILVAFAREHPEIQIKAAILSGRVVTAEAVRTLAELPPREVLLSQVARALQSPLQGLAFVLAAPLKGLAVATEALRRKREDAA